MKLNVVDQKGKKVEEITLDEEVFGQRVNEDLLTQYVHVYRTNQRQGTSATKTRAEVSGGGRKPWRQKGTGRARHGSIRSPIWVHGGIAHGPKPRPWQLSFPKKMKRAAMKSALSEKYLQGKIFIIDKIKFDKPSTKQMQELVENLKLSGNTLVVLNKADQNVLRSASNIKRLKCSLAQNINVYEVLNSGNLLLVKDSVLSLQEKYK